MRGKKALFFSNFHENWAEIIFFILLIIGLIVSLMVQSKVMAYAIILLFGMIAGRFLFHRKDRMAFPYLLIVIGFLIGYTIGVPFGNKAMIIALFIFGISLSYYLHDKGWIRDMPF